MRKIPCIEYNPKSWNYIESKLKEFGYPACAECIENNGLTSEDKGVPSDWDNADVWGPDEVEEFLKFNSSIFIQDQEIEPKIRVEIEQ